ncbi:uncharacterized protein TNCV_4930001 [Trichonephila clavipes]|nr:uncharacterized protein TNCV_4930001 [Trichonephila clavipes]
MPRRRIRAHDEQLSEFERGRIIGLKEGGWANRRFARHIGRSNAVFRRCCGRSRAGPRSGGQIDQLSQHLIHRYQPYDPHTNVRHEHSQQTADRATLQDNAKRHTTRVAMICLIAYQTLLWPAISPDPSPIEHVWDMMERRLHLPENVDYVVCPLEQIWLKIPQETTSGCFITLCHVVWQLASWLEEGQLLIELVTL